MDLHKLFHQISESFGSGHLHLSLFASLLGTIRKHGLDSKNEQSDLGDMGDNVPATLINFLSSRRGL